MALYIRLMVLQTGHTIHGWDLQDLRSQLASPCLWIGGSTFCLTTEMANLSNVEYIMKFWHIITFIICFTLD